MTSRNNEQADQTVRSANLLERKPVKANTFDRDQLERLLIIGKDLIAACRNWENDPDHCIKMIERLEKHCGK